MSLSSDCPDPIPIFILAVLEMYCAGASCRESQSSEAYACKQQQAVGVEQIKIGLGDKLGG